MGQPSLVDSLISRRSLALDLAGMLDEELSRHGAAADAIPLLRRYYSNLLDKTGHVLPLAVFAYVQRVWPVIAELTSTSRSQRVVDAGCGYGTEAYLMALAGADVTAVDLVPDRIALAAGRRSSFSSKSERPLQIQFRAANVLSYLAETKGLDIIWTMEAISHIHPPDQFLRFALGSLRIGGKVIVSDPNRANPLAFLRSVLIRGSFRHKTHQRFKDPESGAPVPYGQEHISSSFRMAATLRDVGFVVEGVVMSGFMGTTVFPGWALQPPLCSTAIAKLGLALARIPLVKQFGTIYTIVARKPEVP